MKKMSLVVLFFLSGSAFAEGSANEPVFNHGQSVHQNHCLKCHTDSVYTRENRIVKSLNALGKQVRVCKDNTSAPWFDDDTDAVINFLNKKYYRF